MTSTSEPTASTDPRESPEPAASPVGSVDKALILLEILAEAGPEGITLRDVAQTSGLNKASVHRLLRALMHRDFAEQVAPDQRYRLGGSVALLAGQFERGENLAMLFAPALAAVSHRTQELVHLGRLDGAKVLYLDKVEPGEPGQVVEPARLTEVIEETQRRGWSSEVEENEQGIACVGVALVRPGGRSVAVSVTGPIERMGARRRAEVAELLRTELSGLAPAGFEVAPLG